MKYLNSKQTQSFAKLLCKKRGQDQGHLKKGSTSKIVSISLPTREKNNRYIFNIPIKQHFNPINLNEKF